MTAMIFTAGAFWVGFLVGIIFLGTIAYLYGHFYVQADTYCKSCYSDVKNERYMTWVEFPGKAERLIKCSDSWHDE